ncbi:MAG: hypothetical protein EOO52_04995 [Gammaproteobacteria bacterium]|nr:MAG: hypothetical protein EOO52_04995 [Gammaproteobacteria bacterium]
MIKKISFAACCSLFCWPFYVSANESVSHEFDWSARTRYADFSGEEDARAASLLLRLNLDSKWSENIETHLQLDNVNRAFKNEHSDGVDLNGNPVIPDAEGFDLNQAYVALNYDSVKFQLGRQRINLDDQRFIGGNGFWQNEQTFDAALTNIKFLSNSQFTYAYIGNVNRIFGDQADNNLSPGDEGYESWDGARPAAMLGDHKHHTHIAQLNYNEWDYSQIIAYAYAIDNKTQPTASNNTFGANYNFTYKADVLKYRVRIESALQKQPELNDSPLLTYYLLDANIGVNRFEFNGRYEVLSNKEGVNFITPLASLHDFQGASNLVQNYAAHGIKDSSIGITWRATPFKIESQYHQFRSYTSNDYLAQELDVTLSYRPNRKHVVSLLLAYFKPEFSASEESSTSKLYLDYAYNF